jgi:ATP-dependent Clp protease ATP-binding subunit ClpA
MLDRFRRHGFDPGARQAIARAKHEAARAGQEKIRSEHVLLALLAVPGPAAEAVAAAGIQIADLRLRILQGNGAASAGLDGDALSSVGIDLDAIRRAADAAFGPGALDRAAASRSRRLMPFADDTRRTLIGAVHAADALGQREISSGHLLLGVLGQQQSAAVSALAEAGADVAALRADVLRRIGPAA